MVNHPQRLVILSPGFPSGEPDSTCLPAQQSFVWMLNRLFPGMELTVIAFQYPHKTLPYQWHGIPVIPLNGQNRKRLFRWIVWFKAWRALKRLSRQGPLAILSFWLDECAFIGHGFSRRYGLKHRIWLLGQDAREGNRYVSWIRPQPATLVAMSDSLAKTFYQNYGIMPSHVVPNGIDASIFPVSAGKRDIDILGVGSLIPLKQFTLFIRMVEKIRSVYPLHKVIICGKGEEEAVLRAQIKTAGLEHLIELSGEKDHYAILQLMQRSRLLIHPSSYEGFSGVCLEALYAGAQVLSFVNPQDGWIRHWHIAENEEAMVKKAVELLQSPNMDHSSVLPYTMEDTARGIIDLFAK